MKPCPHCGSGELVILELTAAVFAVGCVRCGATGPVEPFCDAALASHQRREDVHLQIQSHGLGMWTLHTKAVRLAANVLADGTVVKLSSPFPGEAAGGCEL